MNSQKDKSIATIQTGSVFYSESHYKQSKIIVHCSTWIAITADLAVNYSKDLFIVRTFYIEGKVDFATLNKSLNSLRR